MFYRVPQQRQASQPLTRLGNLGGFAGPAMIGWVKDQTGSFAGGLYFVAGLLILSTVLTLVLSFLKKQSQFG